jgi:hypothetical protein
VALGGASIFDRNDLGKWLSGERRPRVHDLPTLREH